MQRNDNSRPTDRAQEAASGTRQNYGLDNATVLKCADVCLVKAVTKAAKRSPAR